MDDLNGRLCDNRLVDDLSSDRFIDGAGETVLRANEMHFDGDEFHFDGDVMIFI